MLVNLDSIKTLVTGDGKKLKIMDVLVNSETGKVDQIVCRIGLFPFRNDVLVPASLARIESDSKGGGDVYFECDFSYDKVADFRDRSNLLTFSEQAEMTFYSSTSLPPDINFLTSLALGEKEDVLAFEKSKLLSADALKDFYIESPNTLLGVVSDIVFDTENFEIKYFVINSTSKYFNDYRLVPFYSFKKLNWLPGVIHVNLRDVTTEDLKRYPDAINAQLLGNRERHYGRWAS